METRKIKTFFKLWYFFRSVNKMYLFVNMYNIGSILVHLFGRGCRGRDRVVAISAYHHWSCEFASCSDEMYSIQHYVIKFVSDLLHFGDFLLFPPPIKLTNTYKENVQVTLHSLKIMEPRPIVFKEWRDTRTFSNLKSTHCTLLILLIINLVTKKSLCIVYKVQREQ
jgi:hypothetical protein